MRFATEHDFASFDMTALIIEGAVTIIFMLSGAIDVAVKNAHINLELKAGAQKIINTDTARVIEAAGRRSKGEF
jgi:hypothetical protein